MDLEQNKKLKTRVESFTSFSGLFHESTFNNYTLNCINKSLDIDKLIEDKSNALRILNVANYNLHLFCQICLDEFSGSNLVKEKLMEINNEWLSQIRKGNSFNTLTLASEIVNTLKINNFNFTEKLFSKKYVVIKNAFTEIEKDYKSFYKICIYLNPDDMHTVLEEIFLMFQKNMDIFDNVERVEVPKVFFSGSIFDPSKLYPSISITLNYKFLKSQQDISSSRLIKNLIEITEKKKIVRMNNELCHKISSHINISQGFRNYKHFLNLIEVLEDIYDKNNNYAFLKEI